MAASDEVHTGSCLCGAVRFTVAQPLAPALVCHCSMCRKQTGMFLCTTGTYEPSAVAIEGEDGLRWYDSSDHARRGFCRRCGSVLFWYDKRTDRIAVTMGAFDGPTGVRIAEHIFLSDKGDYYEIGQDPAEIR